ncbi:hypothetical protein MFIFM68171_08150 [Madurella fahalii]|uniref:Uncharacterized protein n=1 Tax=Madurella fahalii TaxID=1157608 RepID=A0ABQ0GK55_9PEZI
MPTIFSKKDVAASFPVDETTPFHATKAIYIHEGTEFTLTLTMTDVTAAVAALLSPNLTTAPLLEAAKSTNRSASTASLITLQLTRPNRMSRTWTATKPGSGSRSSNTAVAELSNPLWSLGKWTIKFPVGSPHSGHDIQLRPAGVATRADEFVKDSVPYFWDVVDGRRLCKLYRAMDGKKVEIARFVGDGARARDGVLVVAGQGEEGVDEIVVMLTLVGVLNRSESFRA